MDIEQTQLNPSPELLVSRSWRTRGLFVWLFILLLVISCLLPYFLVKNLFTDVEVYGTVFVVPLCLAAYFRGFPGTLITWGAIVLGTACSLWISYGFSWSSGIFINFIAANVAGLLIGLATAQFSRMHRQIIIAHLAAQAQKLEIIQQQQISELKDLLLLNLNHELRTPLTEVLGYLELLRDYQQRLDEAQQNAFLASAARGCTELMDLISSILDVNNLTHPERRESFELVPAASFVQEWTDSWWIQEKQNYTLVLDIPENLAVWANPQHLRQILRNLLSNAMKYSPLNSRIIISARCLDSESDGTLAFSYVCFSVTDEGLGIPPADIPLLFNKFVRLKRDLAGTIRGTGLGLYICKQLVQAMHGRIWVQSSGKEGEGSRFCFTLPSAATNQTNEQIPSPLKAIGQQTYSILEP